MYRIFFTTGETLLVDDRELTMIGGLTSDTTFSHFVREGEKYIINTKYITHIVPEDKGTSAVLNRPTPQDLKDTKKRELEEIRSDPKKIISRIKRREADD